MRVLRAVPLAFLLTGCAGSDPARTTDSDTPAAACEGYPEGATRVMKLGKVLEPYRWPVAIHRGTGVETELDLAHVPCDTAGDIDWSPHDLLLFVSIPAW